MTKATKPQIMRDLRQMRTSQLEAKKDENSTKLSEFKESLIAKYKPTIDKIIEVIKPVYIQVDELTQSLVNDADINMRDYCHSDLINKFTSYDRVVDHIKDRASWYKGQAQVYSDKLHKEYRELEREWDNLLINCSTMTAKDLRQFIEENKIDLPCMKEDAEEVKTLAVMNVNLDLLFGGNKDVE